MQLLNNLPLLSCFVSSSAHADTRLTTIRLPLSSQQVSLPGRLLETVCFRTQLRAAQAKVRNNLLVVRFPFEARPVLILLPFFFLRCSLLDIPVFISVSQ